MPTDPQRNRLLIMAAALAAMTAAGWLMVAKRDYGAEIAAPKPTTAAPKVPTEKAPQGAQPPAPAQTGVPAERAPSAPDTTPRPPVPLEYAPKPAKPEPKAPEPEPPQTVIQKRVFRGASDDTQSADTLLQFDSDRNGRVDRREAAASDFMARHFDEIDADGDGRITLEEMRAFDARRASR